MDNTVRKRRRPAVACTECRRRKVKCDRTLPCTSCFLGTLICIYNFPIIPTQNSGPSASFVTDAGSDWNPMPPFAMLDSNLQRFYGNGTESSETPLDTVSNIRHQAIATGLSEEGLDAIPGLSDMINTSSPSPSVQDGTSSTKSNLSRGTHLTPNHWKSVFKEVCRKYHPSPILPN